MIAALMNFGKKYSFLSVPLVLFLVAFPKGGIKIAGVPITWGYILLGIAMAVIILNIAVKNQFSISKIRLFNIATLIPFQCYIVLMIAAFGTTNIGFTLSLFISLIFLPWFFIFFLAPYMERLNLNYFNRLLKNALFFVAAYGVILFFFKLFTGKFMEIPYLTINAADAGSLEDKHIDRGGIFKLISTYNNGNIYGVCMLMFLPLYNYVEKSRYRKLFFYLSLFLTLSRTVWIGIILSFLFRIRFTVKSIFYTSVILLISFLLLAGILFYINLDISFLFDKNLGGRLGQLQRLHVSLITSESFEAITEIIYSSILASFGVIGLILFLICFFTPHILFKLKLIKYNTHPYKKNLFNGILIYAIVAASDGAMLYIPVMVFYWFIVSLLYSKNQFFTGYNSKLSLPDFKFTAGAD